MTSACLPISRCPGTIVAVGEIAIPLSSPRTTSKPFPEASIAGTQLLENVSPHWMTFEFLKKTSVSPSVSAFPKMVEMHFLAAQGKHHLGVVEERRRRLFRIGGLNHLEVHLSQTQPILCIRDLGGVARFLCRGQIVLSSLHGRRCVLRRILVAGQNPATQRLRELPRRTRRTPDPRRNDHRGGGVDDPPYRLRRQLLHFVHDRLRVGTA